MSETVEPLYERTPSWYDWKMTSSSVMCGSNQSSRNATEASSHISRFTQAGLPP